MSQVHTGTYVLFSFAPFCTFPAFSSCLLLSNHDVPQAPLPCCFPHPSSSIFETLPYLKVSCSPGTLLEWWDEAYVSMNSSSPQLLFLRIHVLRQGLAVRYNRWSAGSPLVRTVSNCMLFTCKSQNEDLHLCLASLWLLKKIEKNRCPNPLWFLFHSSPLLPSTAPRELINIGLMSTVIPSYIIFPLNPFWQGIPD